MAKPKANRARVRISRGSLGGRYLEFTLFPELRPTLERVREAVFSMIADHADTCGFVDLCAGSGAMGIEAWSCGFRPVLILDSHTGCLDSIRANADNLKADVTIQKGSALDAVRWLPQGKPLVIYADPPYGANDFHQRMLTQLAEKGALEPGSLYLAEYENDWTRPNDVPFRLRKQKRYGRARIDIFEWV